MKNIIYALLLTLSASSAVYTQSSYLAGSINVVQSDVPPEDLTLEAWVQLLSPIESPTEDSIAVVWGDGTTGWLFLVQEVVLNPEVVRRQYINNHTYPARASYAITTSMCCFSETIANVDQGATMTLQTEYTILNPQFQGYNSTVTASQLEETGLVNEPLGFSPTPFDSDNDSIIVSIAELVPSSLGYQPVNEIDPGGNGTLIVEDPPVGETVWDSPSITDQSYIVPYSIREYRNGLRLSNTLVYYSLSVVTPTSATTAPKPDLKVFPNPASQTLRVQTENPTQWSGVLYNAQGQGIQQWANLPADGQIALSCPGGMYFLQLRNGDQVRTARVVVQ